MGLSPFGKRGQSGRTWSGCLHSRHSLALNLKDCFIGETGQSCMASWPGFLAAVDRETAQEAKDENEKKNLIVPPGISCDHLKRHLKFSHTALAPMDHLVASLSWIWWLITLHILKIKLWEVKKIDVGKMCAFLPFSLFAQCSMLVDTWFMSFYFTSIAQFVIIWLVCWP